MFAPPGLLEIKLINKDLYRLGLPTGGTIHARAQRLSKFYNKALRERSIKIALCDTCKFHSDADLEQCPFCGDRSPVKTSEKPIEAELLAPLPGDQDIAPVKLNNVKLDKNEDYLDELVGKIKAHQRSMVENAYWTGVYLKKISDGLLWRMRSDGYGNPVYTGFEEFVRDETGLSLTYARRLINVATCFTESEVAKYGIQRLSIAMTISKDKRSKFLSLAAQENPRGKYLRDLARRIENDEVCDDLLEEQHWLKYANKDNPHEKPIEVLPMGPEFYTGKIPYSRALVQMYRRPTDAGRLEEPTRPAMSIIDKPWFRISLTNNDQEQSNLVIVVKLTKNFDGTLCAIVETKAGYMPTEKDKNKDAES